MMKERLWQLAKTEGTPCYVFDLAALRNRIAFLKEQLSEDIALCYAMKANSFIVSALEPYVERFEVCSPGEYDACVHNQLPEEKLVISGVYKAEADTERMMQNSPAIGWYTVESLQQFTQLDAVSKRRNHPIRILLRLTSGNQFGLTKEELCQLIERRDDYPLMEFVGIQYFSGTQKKLRRMQKEVAMLEALVLELQETYGYTTKEIEYGPGLAVSYFVSEAGLSEAQLQAEAEAEQLEEVKLLQELSDALHTMIAHTGVTVSLELGRGIAAYCGTYMTSVVDLKYHADENFAILDGGIHQLSYFGQMMAMKVPHYNLIQSKAEGEQMLYNLCGSLCTVNDLIVKQLPCRNLQVGDLFLFERAGAYCVMEGISLFLSRALPKVVLLDEQSYHVVRSHQDTWTMNTIMNIKEKDYGNIN